MGLLSFLFGGDKKQTTTTTNTTAVQETSNVSADGGSILAGGDVSLDNSTRVDYRATDSRDLSTTFVDNSRTSDSRSYSSVSYDITPDVVNNALKLVGEADARRSGDMRFSMDSVSAAASMAASSANQSADRVYNASLQFFDKSANAVREAYDKNAETLADTTIRHVEAVTEANRTSDQAVLNTINNFGKYAAWIIGGAIVLGALRYA